MSLLCQLALHFTPLSHSWGKGPQGLFSPTSPSLCFAFTDPHSLSYNFTIDPRPRDNQLGGEVQGEVDQKVFLSYDCGTAQIKYMSPLGEEVKNMSAWEAQTVTLRDTGDLLQGQMPDGTPENHTDKGELENPNAGAVDWGLSCIHCFPVKKKNWILSFPSSPMERAAVAGETRARLAGARGGGPRWVRIFQAQRLSSFFPSVRSGPLILQARMTCWREDNGHTNASWEFGFNGQLCLLFDSENGHCTVVHPGGRWMKEKWENDRAVTDFFRMVSMGDCPAWLQAFLVRWEKMLKTSGK